MMNMKMPKPTPRGFPSGRPLPADGPSQRAVASPRWGDSSRDGGARQAPEVLDRLGDAVHERRHLSGEAPAGSSSGNGSGSSPCVTSAPVPPPRSRSRPRSCARARRACRTRSAELGRAARRADERPRHVGRVVQLRAAAEGDGVRLAVRRRAHRVRRLGGQPLVAPRPVHTERAQARRSARRLLPVDARRVLVRRLVDAVDRASATSRPTGRRRPPSWHRRPASRAGVASTASNTHTVPTTLTRAPRTGSALQNGTCSAARWTTCVTPCSSIARSTCSKSAMSPRTSVTRSSASGLHHELKPGRIVADVEADDGRPFVARATLQVQAPRQPSAPVTRNVV